MFVNKHHQLLKKATIVSDRLNAIYQTKTSKQECENKLQRTTMLVSTMDFTQKQSKIRLAVQKTGEIIF